MPVVVCCLARCGWAVQATVGAVERYDSKGQNEEALSALRAAIDDGAQVILQGNSSATAAVLIDAINKHNEREPGKRVLFPELFGGRPDPDQRKVQLLAFPL
jgi:branched-chain amino acid transport system substrate-binding protein